MQLVLILLLLANNEISETFSVNLDHIIHTVPQKLKWNNILIVSDSISKSCIIKSLKNSKMKWRYKNPRKIDCSKERNLIILDASKNFSKTCLEKFKASFNVLVISPKIEELDFTKQVSFYTLDQDLQQCIFSQNDKKLFCYNLGIIKDYFGLSIKVLYRTLGTYGGSKMSFNILEDVVKELNLTLNPILRNDVHWGNAPANGEWENSSAFSGKLVTLILNAP